MIHERTNHTNSHPSVNSAITSRNHLTEHSSHQHRIYHAQSDCGHGSPPLKRTHSLLRHFSLRSRNSLTSRKSRHLDQVQPPPPPPLTLAPVSSLSAAPRLENTTTDSGSSASHSISSHSNGSSDLNSSLSIWKKWRVRNVNEGDEERAVTGHNDALSSPMTGSPQAPGGKRSLFLPFLTVSRLFAPFQISSSSSSSLHEDSSCLVIPPQLQTEPELHNHENHKKVNEIGNDNAPSWDGDMDLIVELIRQADGWVNAESQIQNEMPMQTCLTKEAAPLLPSALLPPLPENSLPSSLPFPHFPSSSSPLSSPPLSPLSSNTSPPNSPQESFYPPVDALDLNPVLVTTATIDASEPPSSSSPSTPKSTPSHSSPQPSSNPKSASDLNPNLKLSISQKRRAKFILGDESDLDYDPLGISASISGAPPAANGGPKAISTPTGSALAHAVVLSNNTAVDIHRPPLVRRERLAHETRSQDTASTGTKPGMANGTNTRRWTLSSALTDECISDEGLSKELERIRELLEWDCPSPSPSHLSPTWLITQRALLTTRELILTERHYLSSLLLLLSPDSTLTPVPEMMVSCVKELVDVSKRLLKGMEGDPSVRGVAEVFIEVGGVSVSGHSDGDESQGAESAFVGWCRAVGGWFQDDSAVPGDTQAVVDVRRKRKKSIVVRIGGEEHLVSEHEGSNSPTTTNEHAHTSPLMRTVSTWRKSMPSVAGLGDGGVWRRDRDKDEGDGHGNGHGHRGRLSPTSFTFGAIGTSPSISMASTSNSKPRRKPAVRDLAILPTQRVMRYVLLYRDLLANTPPSSSSYPIVKRAVETACRIAEKCDRAQGNAAFIAGGSTVGSSSSGSSNSMLTNNKGRRCSNKRVMTLPEHGLKLTTGSTAYATSPSFTNLMTSSPTKSHFLPSSLAQPPSEVPSESPLPLSSSKPTLIPSSLPLSASPTKKINFLPTPPSSFHSKLPITTAGQSIGSSSTSSDGSSTPTTTATSSSSSSSSSLSSPFSSLSSKAASSGSNVSSRMPKSLSAVSLMSLVNGLGRGVSGTSITSAAVADSGPARGYARVIPTKIQV